MAGLRRNGGYFSDRVRRTNTRHDLSDCPHTTSVIVEVENDHGAWEVAICVNCGVQQGPPRCAHVSCSWDADRTLLTCDNCGIDGT